MAISQVQCRNFALWIGLSSDNRPTGGTIAGAGPGFLDRFFEEDTGKQYIFDASGTWVEYYPDQPSTRPFASNTTVTWTNQAASNNTPTVHTNSYWRGVSIYINVTGLGGGAPSITPILYGWSPNGGNKYYTLLTGAAITTVSNVFLQLYPGILSTANQYIPLALPANWAFGWTFSGTGSITGTVNIDLMR